MIKHINKNNSKYYKSYLIQNHINQHTLSHYTEEKLSKIYWIIKIFLIIIKKNKTK